MAYHPKFTLRKAIFYLVTDLVVESALGLLAIFYWQMGALWSAALAVVSCGFLVYMVIGTVGGIVNNWPRR